MAPPAMASTALTQTVDFWTAQAVMASGYLVALYRILGDDRQVALAMENIKQASLQNVSSTRQTESVAQNLHTLGPTQAFARSTT